MVKFECLGSSSPKSSLEEAQAEAKEAIENVTNHLDAFKMLKDKQLDFLKVQQQK